METAHKVSVLLIAVVLLAVSVFSLYSFFDTDNHVSQKEKRTLAKLPPFTLCDWFSGDYGEALNRYMPDHVLMRQPIIHVMCDMERLMCLKTHGIYFVDMKKPKW